MRLPLACCVLCSLACGPCAPAPRWSVDSRTTLSGLYRLGTKRLDDQLRLETDGGFSHCVNGDPPPALLEQGAWRFLDGGAYQWVDLDSYTLTIDRFDEPTGVGLLIEWSAEGFSLGVPSDLEDSYLPVESDGGCRFEP